MSNPERKFASPHDFDTVSDLIVEGVFHPDDAAAIAGLQMQREETREKSEREFDEWLAANEPPPTAPESDEERF